jgi:hypothetical protein
MLFDVRGRGRRRTIQVIYLGLAVLMGGGLVFFGIGGNTSGGLFDAIGLTGNSTKSSNAAFTKLERQAERQVALAPRNPAAWADLTRVRYQVASQGSNYDTQNQAFTTSGRRALARVDQAWARYLALSPRSPDANIAALMVQAFAPSGLNQPAKAADAAEIVANVRPSANAFYQLAVFSYLAHKDRKAQLAAQEALRRAPPAERTALKTQLDDAKKQANKPAAAATTPSLTPAG